MANQPRVADRLFGGPPAPADPDAELRECSRRAMRQMFADAGGSIRSGGFIWSLKDAQPAERRADRFYGKGQP